MSSNGDGPEVEPEGVVIPMSDPHLPAMLRDLATRRHAAEDPEGATHARDAARAVDEWQAARA